MTQVCFLETSSQGIRLFYEPSLKQQVEALLESSDEVYISEYSWFEFYQVFTIDLVRIYHAANESGDFSDILSKLGSTFSKKMSVLKVLSTLYPKTKDGVTAEMIADAALFELDGGLRTRYLFHKKGKQIKEVKTVSCSMAAHFRDTEIVTYPDEDPENPVVRFVDPDQCAIDRAKCNLPTYINQNIKKLEKAIEAIQKSESDDKFVKYGNVAAKAPKSAIGSKCRHISDWLMATQAPKGSVIVTSDEDWEQIGKALEFRVVRILTPPLYDKNQIKARLALAENEEMIPDDG